MPKLSLTLLMLMHVFGIFQRIERERTGENTKYKDLQTETE